MKNKLLILFLMGTSAFAQLPQKGDWLIGTSVANLNIILENSRTSSGSITLLGGKFTSERVVLGASLPVDWSSSPELSFNPTSSIQGHSFTYGLVPFARFYLTNTRVRPYLEVGAGYLFSRYRGSIEVSHNGVTFEGNAGLAYFVNRNISFDAVANLTNRPYPAAYGFLVKNYNQLNFRLRFQVFLWK